MENTKDEISLEKANLENEKLKLEIAALKKSKPGIDFVIRYIPLITILVAIAGFLFGIYQYRTEQIENRRSQEESSKREFMKPLLEEQLSIYLKASDAAATIATTTNTKDREEAINSFWSLYYGQLVFVENTKVSGAMKDFGNCLNKGAECTQRKLQELSLKLASSLQTAMLKSWNMNPEDYAKDKFSNE
jgi:hypothetical protein